MKNLPDYPVERIKLDLQILLRNCEESIESNFTYLPYLKGRKKINIDIETMSAFEVFMKIHSEILNHPNIISEEVIQRLLNKNQMDLFHSSLMFLSKVEFKNDDYYWTPNVEIFSVFSLIKVILPSFIKLYREYVIGGNEINENVMLFINDKFPEEIEQFKGIFNDHKRFNTFSSNKLNKQHNLENSSLIISSKLITLPYWIDDYESFFLNREILNINESVEIALVPEISYVEIEIEKQVLQIPYNVYLELNKSSAEAIAYVNKMLEEAKMNNKS